MIVCLYGVKASGKTTLAKLLAARCDYEYVDTDQLLEKAYSEQEGRIMSCVEIYKRMGEEYFRCLEKKVIQGLAPSLPTVIAVGGSSLLDESNRMHLQKIASLCYLKIDFLSFKQRILAAPLLPGFVDADDVEGSLQQYYDKRVVLYERAADKVLVDASVESLWRWVMSL